MVTKTEGTRIDDLVLFEEDDFYSREVVTIASGADLSIGAVLGVVTATGKYVSSDPTATDGSQTPVAVLIRDAKAASADVTDALVIARHARLIRSALVFDDAIDDSTKRATAVAALKARGILTDV